MNMLKSAVNSDTSTDNKEYLIRPLSPQEISAVAGGWCVGKSVTVVQKNGTTTTTCYGVSG